MLTAPWGAGKSYYIRNELCSFLKENNMSYALVSVYGLSSIAEIKKELYDDYKNNNKNGIDLAMKKIPTLFVREFSDDHTFILTKKVTTGLEWVLQGDGIATVKMDGSCTAIMNGIFYKRYDAKQGKQPPIGAIPCCAPDLITGHWPHWVKVDPDNKADQWLYGAYKNADGETLPDGTYEAIGPHFQSNPYGLAEDTLERHGARVIDVPRTFDGLKEYLEQNYMEGIVFWKDGEPECKIKRRDFGFSWNKGNLDDKVKGINQI